MKGTTTAGSPERRKQRRPSSPLHFASHRARAERSSVCPSHPLVGPASQTFRAPAKLPGFSGLIFHLSFTPFHPQSPGQAGTERRRDVSALQCRHRLSPRLLSLEHVPCARRTFRVSSHPPAALGGRYHQRPCLRRGNPGSGRCGDLPEVTVMMRQSQDLNSGRLRLSQQSVS